MARQGGIRFRVRFIFCPLRKTRESVFHLLTNVSQFSSRPLANSTLIFVIELLASSSTSSSTSEEEEYVFHPFAFIFNNFHLTTPELATAPLIFAATSVSLPLPSSVSFSIRVTADDSEVARDGVGEPRCHRKTLSLGQGMITSVDC